MKKREVVEQWLKECCMELEIMQTANDPYPPDEAEQDAILQPTDGLINYVEYEPGSDEWENFHSEGWLYTSPTDAQVEKLYPIADEYFMRQSSGDGE